MYLRESDIVLIKQDCTLPVFNERKSGNCDYVGCRTFFKNSVGIVTKHENYIVVIFVEGAYVHLKAGLGAAEYLMKPPKNRKKRAAR